MLPQTPQSAGEGDTLILELTLLNCVQQASIGTRVSLSTFARGRHYQAPSQLIHGFVSLLLAIWAAC